MKPRPPLSFLHADFVRREWIDHNGHMNTGYFSVAFDRLTDAWFDYIGLNAEHRLRHRVTTFAAEAHILYLRELHEGDPLAFGTQLLGFDEKRIHYFQTMYHARTGFLAATQELMSLHIDLATRRPGPMDRTVQAVLEAVRAEQAHLPVPPQAGRVMGLKAGSPGRA